MKKLLFFLILSVFLVMAGCTNDNGSAQPDDQKQTENNSGDKEQNKVGDSNEDEGNKDDKSYDVTLEEEKDLLALYESQDKALNEYDAELWTENSHPQWRDLEAAKAWMEQRKKATVYVQNSDYEVLYSNGDEAVVYATYEYRQKTPFDEDNNWNSNQVILEIAKKYEGEWKTYNFFILRTVWLNENNEEDPTLGIKEFNPIGQLQLVKQIQEQNLPIFETLYNYNKENWGSKD